ncbi:MAG TPA: non-heme iron oxygenase ferredoxin subunit [Longimicrobiales bacterium]|nr:non-heme iron oxygenase ferredoxin subunit [Longimicrobiales bacterium]
MAEFVKVASVDQLPAGSALQVVMPDGLKVCLANSEGEIYAIADRCTHADFSMSIGTVHGGGTIECAWHGARYNMATGKAIRLPAIKPIKTFEVKVEGGDILVAADE